MTVRNLSTLDRDMFQPLGRILQEAFADGLIATGTQVVTKEYDGSGWQQVISPTLDLVAACTGKGATVVASLKMRKTTSGDWSAALACNAKAEATFGTVATAAGGFNAATFKVEAAAGAVLTDQGIACIKMEHYLPASGITGPTWSAMMQFNCLAGANEPDYLFYAQNKPSVAMTESSGVAGTKTGAIKVQIAGSVAGTHYIRLYDSAD